MAFYVGIDVGTYLCRFILAQKSDDTATQNFTIIETNTYVVNFGTMQPGKNITKNSTARLHRVIEKIQTVLEKHKEKKPKIRCVATAALRFAPNSQIIIDNIEKKFGLKIDIISADEEIYLVALATQNLIENDSIVLDVGSGSTEIAYVQKENDTIKIADYISLNLGLNNCIESMKKRKKELVRLREFMGKHRNTPLICSKCGTLKIAYNYHHKKRKTNLSACKFKTKDLSSTVAIFKQMNTEALKKLPSVGMQKVNLIQDGLPWIHAVLKQINRRSFILSENDLKEGIIIEMMNHEKKRPTSMG